MLRTNLDAYREAASHYVEAARIAATADAKVARAYTNKQGQTLSSMGKEFGRNAALLEAIELFGDMLASLSRTDDQLDWAATQVNLGIALRVLGEREGGTEKLEQAVAPSARSPIG
jgi:hypothetical protein